MNDLPLSDLLRRFADENCVLALRNAALAANAFSDIAGPSSGIEPNERIALMHAVRDRRWPEIVDGAVWAAPNGWTLKRDATPEGTAAAARWSEALAGGITQPCGDSGFAEVAAGVCAKLGMQAIRPMPSTSSVEAVLARGTDGALIRIAGMKVAGPSSAQLGVVRDTSTTVIESGRSLAWAYVASGAPSATTLGDILARWRPATTEAAMAVLGQLIVSIEELHHAGVTHGAIGIENVVLTPEGRVTVLDVGLASLAGKVQSNDSDLASYADVASLVLTDRPINRRSGNVAVQSWRDARPDLPSEFASLLERCISAQPGVPQPTARDISRSLNLSMPTAPISLAALTSQQISHPAASGTSAPIAGGEARAAEAGAAFDLTAQLAEVPAAPTVQMPTTPATGQMGLTMPPPPDPATAYGMTDPTAVYGVTEAPVHMQQQAAGEPRFETTNPPKSGRGKLPLVLGGLALVACLIGAAVFFLGRSSSDKEVKSSVATVARGVATFEDLEVNKFVTAERTWVVKGGELAGETVLQNDGDDDVVVVYDELIPDDVADDPADVTFDPPLEADMIINAAAGRRILTVPAGDSTRVEFVAEVGDNVSDEELADWTDAWSDEYEAHLDDPEFSPIDGDVDGLPDNADSCADVSGGAATAGCPDEDADGVRDDDGSDACVTAAGPAATAGCPDEDADGVRDDDGTDACVGVAGTAATAGCPDADADGVRDDDGSDVCLDAAGPATSKGCPDGDGDTVSDADDACPTAAGPVEGKGCPDTDGDGVDDANDKCVSESGAASAGGCPDRDGDSVADGSDFCPDNPGEIGGCPDSDGDGAVDKDDACPSVPSSDKSGCPDSDGDGFHDGVDKCPQKSGPEGGCPVTSTTQPSNPGGGSNPPPPPPSNRSISLSGPSSATVGVLSDRFSVSTNGFSASSISWSNGGSGSTARYEFFEPGTFTVSVTVTDENGKSYSKSMSVTVS